MTIYHYRELGLYVYASTTEILEKALKLIGFDLKCNEVIVKEGNIIQIEPDGEIWSSEFKVHETERFFGRWYNYGYNDFEENAENQKGSGLGLYICRQLMYKMNGEIFAEIKDNFIYVTAVFEKV